MLAAALLLGLTPIDFQCPPTCIVDLRPRLEQISGHPLRISPELINEVVMIRATNVAPEEVMANVADVLCSKWADRDGYQILTPDHDEQEARFRKIHARVSQRMQELIDKKLALANARAAENKDLKGAARRLSQGGGIENLPLFKDAWEVMNKLGAETIVDHMLRRSFIWLGEIEGMSEGKLPPALVNQLRQSFQEFGELTQELSRLGFEPTRSTNEIGRGIVSFHEAFFVRPGTWDPSVLVGLGGTIYWENEAGGLIHFSLWSMDDTRDWLIEDRELWERVIPGKKFTAHCEAMKIEWRGKAQSSLEAGIIPTALPPGDPASWWRPEECTLSDEPEADYCFVVPDDLSPPLLSLGPGNGLKIIEKDGWTLVREQVVEAIRNNRLDRNLFERYAAFIRNRHSPTVQELFADERAEAAWNTVATLASQFAPPCTSFGINLPGAEFLGEETTARLRKGGTISFSSLTPGEQRSFIRETGFSENWSFRDPSGKWVDFATLKGEDATWSPLKISPAEWQNAGLEFVLDDPRPADLVFSTLPNVLPEDRFYSSFPGVAMEGDQVVGKISQRRSRMILHVRRDLRLEDGAFTFEGSWPVNCPKLTAKKEGDFTPISAG